MIHDGGLYNTCQRCQKQKARPWECVPLRVEPYGYARLWYLCRACRIDVQDAVELAVRGAESS